MSDILVIGVGALGSHFMQFSRNWDAEFDVVDFDRVEHKNVLSQFHFKRSVRKSKVSSIGECLAEFGIFRMIPRSVRFCKQNAGRFVTDKDHVVDCVDNLETRSLIVEACDHFNIPCLHGGLSGDGQFGVVLWDKDFTLSPAQEETQRATCENEDRIAFYAVVAARMVLCARNFLDTGKKASAYIRPLGETWI